VVGVLGASGVLVLNVVLLGVSFEWLLCGGEIE
jgi:hypothetical protein